MSKGNKLEYRWIIRVFVSWCEQNYFCINTDKTKELVIDFCRKAPHLMLVNIQGHDIETVVDYKYLGVHLNNELDWSTNIDTFYKKGLSRLPLQRGLRAF